MNIEEIQDIKTELVDIDRLVELKDNPRDIDEDQLDELVKSIKKDPQFIWLRPLLVNDYDGKLEVYAGNQRLKAVKILGWPKVPCKVSKDTPKKLMAERAIKDNIASGKWNKEGLINYLGENDLKLELRDFKVSFDEIKLSDIQTPDFQPVGVEDQPRLDEKKKVICPKCGEEFEPK